MLQQPQSRILTHDVRVLLQAEESNDGGLADLSSADYEKSDTAMLQQLALKKRLGARFCVATTFFVLYMWYWGADAPKRAAG